jgi:hypothetical protein
MIDIMYCMYREVPGFSRLLYSICTGREAQCNTTNNYTQSILPTVLFSILILSWNLIPFFVNGWDLGPGLLGINFSESSGEKKF